MPSGGFRQNSGRKRVLTDEQRKERAAARARAWRAKNVEHFRAYSRMQAQKHKAKRAERNKQWKAGKDEEWKKRDREKKRIASSKRRKELGEKFKESQRESRFRRVYGITLAQYKEMLAAQGAACAICKAQSFPNRLLSVDHCHSTGRVRGLLCIKCNTALGHAGDNISVLKEMISYLDRSND